MLLPQAGLRGTGGRTLPRLAPSQRCLSPPARFSGLVSRPLSCPVIQRPCVTDPSMTSTDGRGHKRGRISSPRPPMPIAAHHSPLLTPLPPFLPPAGLTSPSGPTAPTPPALPLGHVSHHRSEPIQDEPTARTTTRSPLRQPEPPLPVPHRPGVAPLRCPRSLHPIFRELHCIYLCMPAYPSCPTPTPLPGLFSPNEAAWATLPRRRASRLRVD